MQLQQCRMVYCITSQTSLDAFKSAKDTPFHSCGYGTLTVTNILTITVISWSCLFYLLIYCCIHFSIVLSLILILVYYFGGKIITIINYMILIILYGNFIHAFFKWFLWIWTYFLMHSCSLIIAKQVKMTKTHLLPLIRREKTLISELHIAL